MSMRHFECPSHDWSEDVDDEVQGYVDLYEHEQSSHPSSARRITSQ